MVYYDFFYKIYRISIIKILYFDLHHEKSIYLLYRSITNLTALPNNDENIRAFERHDSSDVSLTSSYSAPKKKPQSLEQQIITKQLIKVLPTMDSKANLAKRFLQKKKKKEFLFSFLDKFLTCRKVLTIKRMNFCT